LGSKDKIFLRNSPPVPKSGTSPSLTKRGGKRG
jgi:hypothetical protein